MKKITLISMSILISCLSKAQYFSAGNDTTINCGDSVTLSCANTYTTITGPNVDDFYSSAINIGFSFSFYGGTYTQCIISGNGTLSFNLSNAGTFCPWSISTALPSTATSALFNCILFPWQDLYRVAGGTFRRATIGSAPNRIFVLEYCNVSMFSCTTNHFTGQVLLYETSNVIETHIYNKPVCTTWNSGWAIHGIQNINGTIAHIVPGRNYPTQWTASNDGQRFTRISSTSYTITSIPFAPLPMGLNSFAWYENGNTLIGNSSSVSVSPLVTTYYVATTQTCGGITVSDTVVVNVQPSISSGAVISDIDCFGNSNGTITLNPSGGIPSYHYQWSTSDTISSISNLNAGNYSCIITDSVGCSLTDTFSITEPPLFADTLTSTPTDASCVGSASAVVNGGTPPYQYQWSNSATTSTINNLCSGWYYITVTDDNGCVLMDSVFVNLNTGIVAEHALNDFNLFPNPATTEIVVESAEFKVERIEMWSVVGERVKDLRALTLNPSPSGEGLRIEVSSLPAGIYFVAVTDEKGNRVVRKVVKM